MKKFIIWAVILVLVLGLVFQDQLIRAYVSHNHEKLEAYALEMLENGEEGEGSYGPWETYCYPGEGMVEFYTGGWGLAPSSTYKGFYYSADDTHKLFSAANSDAASMGMEKDFAEWTDGTDNHGTSVRITENWFWFEASF